jgi:zinc and cadmium transporter
MSTLLWIIIATVANGFVALIGAVTLGLKENTLKKLLLILVAFSAGALLSGALLHLMVESFEHLAATTAFIYFIIGFVVFFLVEKFLYWHHCHKSGVCEVHPYTYLILFGDGIHNFIDGLVIAVSFVVNAGFGTVTTFLIIAHEIPQEMGNFGILVYGGMRKMRALVYNFISQLTCVIGGIVGFFAATSIQPLVPFLLPFAAGGFIYIAASDLIPELHRESDLRKSMLTFIFFLIGIAFLAGMKLIFGE